MLKLKALKFFKMSGMTCPVAQLHIPEELNYQNEISVLHCVSLLSIFLCGRKHVFKCWLFSTVACCYTQLHFVKVFCLCSIKMIRYCLQNQKSEGVFLGNLQVRVPLDIPPTTSVFVMFSQPLHRPNRKMHQDFRRQIYGQNILYSFRLKDLGELCAVFCGGGKKYTLWSRIQATIIDPWEW